MKVEEAGGAVEMPEIVVDDFETNNLQEAFSALPERMVILQNNEVRYVGGKGPFDYNLNEVEDWLMRNTESSM